MLIAKVPAAIAAVLLISSISAQAMEFADRPGPIAEVFRTASTIHAMVSEDPLRRQIYRHLVFLPTTIAQTKLADRPRSISNLIQIRLAHMTFNARPGRLSAEFSAFARSSGMKFEYGPGEIFGGLKPSATRTAKKFDDRPGLVSNRYTALAALNIKFADRNGFTSSIAKSITRPGMRPRPASAGFCVGSMAPCGLLKFAQNQPVLTPRQQRISH